ncbi:Lrp/AsnC family transcriptional regulator [Arthrobacter flavus]|uniref:Lrp/AsnC family transcriptional regulator n=1 Tax=Arthrobacter flavus TaxID=95172 RepID=A0ABW4Q8I4_9MICC
MATLDSRLIEALQIDGRMSYTALAEICGVPRAIVSNHVQKLLGSGVVEIVAVTHPELLGVKALAHVSIEVSGPTQPVAAALRDSDAAVYVSVVSGQFSVITELRVSDHRSLFEEVAWIRRLPGVRAVSTLVYAEVLRGIFMPKEALQSEIRLDSTDVKIIELLERDGRMSFLKLGELTGLSPSAVRTRTNQLIANSILRIGAVVKRRGGSVSTAMGMGLNIVESASEVSDAVAALPGMEFCARTLGRFDLVGTTAAGSASEAFAMIERLKGMQGVLAIETWTHLEVSKEHYARRLDLRH